MGYAKSLFVAPPPSFLMCPQCLDPYKDPSVICRQQHMVCKDCIPFLSCCVICRSGVDHNAFQHPVDINIDRFIKSLHAKCQHYERGCQWIGPVSSEAIHMESCDYSNMKCPNESCLAQVLKRDLETHKQSCQFTLRACNNTPSCKRMGNQSDMFKHVLTCPWNPCTWFTVDGCPFKGTAGAVTTHEQYCSRIHEELLALRKRVREFEYSSAPESTVVSSSPPPLKELLENEHHVVSQTNSDKVDVTPASPQALPCGPDVPAISVGRGRVDSADSALCGLMPPSDESSVAVTSIPPLLLPTPAGFTLPLAAHTLTDPTSLSPLFSAPLSSQTSDVNGRCISPPPRPTSTITALPVSNPKAIPLASKPSNKIGLRSRTHLAVPPPAPGTAGHLSLPLKRERYAHLKWTRRDDTQYNNIRERPQGSERHTQKKVRILSPDSEGVVRRGTYSRNPGDALVGHNGHLKRQGEFHRTTGAHRMGNVRGAFTTATLARPPLNKHGRTPRRYPEDDEHGLIVTSYSPNALPTAQHKEEKEGLVVTSLVPKLPCASNVPSAGPQPQRTPSSASFVSDISFSNLLSSGGSNSFTDIPTARTSEQHCTILAATPQSLTIAPPFCASRSPTVGAEADVEVAAMLQIAYPSPLSNPSPYTVPMNDEKKSDKRTITDVTATGTKPQINHMQPDNNPQLGLNITVSPSQLHDPQPISFPTHLGLLNARRSTEGSSSALHILSGSESCHATGEAHDNNPFGLSAIETTSLQLHPAEYLNLSPVLPEANFPGNNDQQCAAGRGYELDGNSFIW